MNILQKKCKCYFSRINESGEKMIITAIRTILLYFVIMLTVRIMGKRQISELQTNELVVTLLISDIAAIPMQNTEQSLLSGVIPIFILMVSEIFISVLMLKHPGFRKVICGRPVIVISDGKLDQKAMKELRMSTEDLFEQLRQKDAFNLEEIAYAIVETNGKLSVMKKPANETVTSGQMGIFPENNGMQAVVISDGEIAESSLSFCGLSKDWLYQVLKKEKCKAENIFIMTADKSKKYNIIFKEK